MKPRVEQEWAYPAQHVSLVVNAFSQIWYIGVKLKLLRLSYILIVSFPVLLHLKWMSKFKARTLSVVFYVKFGWIDHIDMYVKSKCVINQELDLVHVSESETKPPSQLAVIFPI